MSKRTYGQFCGLARALELVGERWALLIVRDLLVGPKRFTDLRNGLPRIPSNILSTRLRELEHATVVRRRVRPRPDGSIVYELTEYGQELDEAVRSLGRWGARLLEEPGPEEVVTVDSVVMAMRTTFRPEAADDVVAGYELRVGEITVAVRVHRGELDARPGPLPDADLVLEPGESLRALLAGQVSPAEALAAGRVRITGDPALLDRFVDIFRIPAMATQAG